MSYFSLVQIFFFVLVSNTFAAKIKVLKPCSHEVMIAKDHNPEIDESVGEGTLRFLKRSGIPVTGSEAGITSINHTPTGLAAIEVISDTEMMMYGWCYAINGYSPELMPNEVEIKENDTIKWWFGFAHYLNGEWITQCTPSSERRESAFCQKMVRPATILLR